MDPMDTNSSVNNNSPSGETVQKKAKTEEDGKLDTVNGVND